MPWGLESEGDHARIWLGLPRPHPGACRAGGVKVAFVPTISRSLAQDLAAGFFDIAMGGISVTLCQKTGLFSAPYLREGKAAIARCADQTRYQSLVDIDRPQIRV